MQRYTKLPLPPYRFLPGKAPHPEKEGGYLKGNKPEVEELTEENYHKNLYFLYALDLFNSHYFWESHVYWEAIWNKNQRIGEAADFLKGLIKIAAAMVKKELGSEEAYKGHIVRAIELLRPIRSNFGIDIEELVLKLERLDEITIKLTE